MGPLQVVAIDWSGQQGGGKKDIAVAEASLGRLDEILTGLDRTAVGDHLIAEKHRLEEDYGEARMVIGFDFAFSLPAWFLEEQGIRGAPALWELMDEHAEEWLAGAAPWPFWGRHSQTTRPPDLDKERAHRQTEGDVAAVTKTHAKSVFQLVGSGQVGPGSLRGMPTLHRLSKAGFHVWPFDPPGWPLIIELYPRLLTGEVNKRQELDRRAHLARYRGLSPACLEQAAQTEHAFDAALSALVMNRYLHEIMELKPAEGAYQLEGKIWHPSDPGFTPGSGIPDFLALRLPDRPFVFVFEDQDGLWDGPFDPAFAGPLDDEGPHGAVAMNNDGSPRVLRILRQEGDRIETADGLRIRFDPLASKS